MLLPLLLKTSVKCHVQEGRMQRLLKEQEERLKDLFEYHVQERRMQQLLKEQEERLKDVFAIQLTVLAARIETLMQVSNKLFNQSCLCYMPACCTTTHATACVATLQMLLLQAYAICVKPRCLAGSCNQVDGHAAVRAQFCKPWIVLQSLHAACLSVDIQCTDLVVVKLECLNMPVLFCCIPFLAAESQCIV